MIKTNQSNQLNSLRRQIDTVDRRVVRALASRLRLVSLIGLEKKRLGLAIVDHGRENKVLSSVRAMAVSEGLDSELIQSVFKLVIEQSRKEQI